MLGRPQGTHCKSGCGLTPCYLKHENYYYTIHVVISKFLEGPQSQAQGTSLFTSAATNQMDCPKVGPCMAGLSSGRLYDIFIDPASTCRPTVHIFVNPLQILPII